MRKKAALLDKDNTPIKVVPAAAREVWEPKPPKLTERQMKARRKEAQERIARKRAGRA